MWKMKERSQCLAGSYTRKCSAGNNPWNPNGSLRQRRGRRRLPGMIIWLQLSRVRRSTDRVLPSFSGAKLLVILEVLLCSPPETVRVKLVDPADPEHCTTCRTDLRLRGAIIRSQRTRTGAGTSETIEEIQKRIRQELILRYGPHTLYTLIIG